MMFVNRRPRRAPMGLTEAEGRGHAHHNGLHQDPADVLHEPQRRYGRARRAQTRDLAS